MVNQRINLITETNKSSQTLLEPVCLRDFRTFTENMQDLINLHEFETGPYKWVMQPPMATAI